MNESKQMDISSPKDRSIRRIPLSKKVERSEEIVPPRKAPPKERKTTPSRGRGKKLVYLSVLVIGLFIFLFSTIFASGKLIVSPKTETVVFDSEVLSTQGTGEVPYEVMTIERQASDEVKATGEKEVEDRSFGEIIVYNNFSTDPQRLIANTRFETPEGLVYRIRDSIDVPGRKGSGAEAVPGSLTVTVYADAPGEKYNIGLSDFTLPALKGDERYETLYARSKTPMTGGFVGLKKSVSEEEKAGAKEALREKLRGELFKEAASSKTDGYVLFNDAMFVEFESLPDTTSGNSVVINEKGKLYGVIFNKETLSKYIASKTVASFAGESILVENLEELDFTAIDKAEARPWETGEFSFNLLGNPFIVWQFDQENLQNELAGKLKKEARAILTTYPSIERAEISMRPFWKRSFPKNPEKVRIIRKLQDNSAVN